jgi:hypothetical protein
MQSRKHSVYETVIGTAVGYASGVAATAIVFPLFGIAVSMSENLGVSVIFTGISLVRSYLLRRAFNAWHTHQEAHSV